MASLSSRKPGSGSGAGLLGRIRAGYADSVITHVEDVPARAGMPAEWPSWAPQLLVDRLGARGIPVPWSHQRAAADLAWSGSSVVVATGTASGKSLAYQLPVLSRLLTDERATALYLSPTKALAADQLRSIQSLALTFKPVRAASPRTVPAVMTLLRAEHQGTPSLFAGIADSDLFSGDGVGPPRAHGAALHTVRAAVYDGDTPLEERDWIRAHGRLVLTNPDMLHAGILPSHSRWSSFLRRLDFIVVDECHGYRGVFGSHVAHVLRRLRRVCAKYHANPVFVLASATVAAPAESATRLVGAPVREVTEDGSPRGATTFALWEPPLTELAGENGAPIRRPAVSETARLLADLVVEGAHTLAFVQSRRGAEMVARSARRVLAEAAPDLMDRVAAYRAGYLSEERRELEAALSSGELVGVAATNALELGVDITGLDAVVLTGYPGTIASLWQQAGRAGRAQQDALAVFVARGDPLDTYLVHHPEAIFGRPVEATVLDPDNPHVLQPHLCCAAAELPITDDDVEIFGPGTPDALADLVHRGLLRRRPSGWFWTSRDRPTVDIRGTGGEPVRIVEHETGRLLGTVDQGAAHSSLHDGAVYLHQGTSYLVDQLDLDDSVALVHQEEPDWTTSARDITDIRIIETLRTRALGDLSVHYGTVDVTNQVVSYLRRRAGSGEIIDERPLDLPPRQLRTRAVWYAVEPSVLAEAALEWVTVPGAVHAAEHAAIGLLPLVATCDRWDVGGVSTAMHEDTERTTVFVYDGHPGGAGFAARGYEALVPWLTATRDTIADCECATGCPSCVQSPKCGNSNNPLDKDGARRLLNVVLRRLSAEH